MDLDKDILIKGNKVYSPETCIFVPQKINSIIAYRNSSTDSPSGVSYHKRDKIYFSYCNDGKGKLKHLGTYECEKNAFIVYKKFKENVIVQTANEYKQKIPTKLYSAMVNYEVNIND
jgi:hypothetical protein